MIYKYEEGILEEYKVIINFEKLKKIREEIIYNCSIVKPCTGVFSDFLPFSEAEKETMKHFNQKNLSYVQENNGWPDTYYYEYTYDKYYFPKIIKLIDEILKGNESIIDDLFETEDLKYDINEYKDNKTLKEVIDLINDYSKTNNKQTLIHATTLLNQYKHTEIIKPIKSIKEYYYELSNCFKFEKTNSDNYEELNRLKEVLGKDWQIKINKLLNSDTNIKASVKNQYIKKLMK